MQKKKTHNVFLKEFFKGKEFIYAIVNLTILVIIISLTILTKRSFSFNSLIDIGTFTAVISAFIINFVSTAVYSAYVKSKEDERKLTTNYDQLSTQYSANTKILEYGNYNATQQNIEIGSSKTTCMGSKKVINGIVGNVYRIPITDVISFQGKKVHINNDNYRKMYKHPDIINGMTTEIFKAHSFSRIYNQLMIRCDNIEENGNEITIYFSKTTYYESLITNRAMDYSIDGKSVREVCAYGPYLHPLIDSELSNHIGYNGFVETEDGKIIFIFRSKHVSIAKNTIQSSIGSSLKVKYACKADGVVTNEGIVFAMKKEIEDELCLRNIENYLDRQNEIFSDFSFKNILYFYRELVEGGKPQLMFYTKIHLTSEEISIAYTKGVKNAKKGDFYCSIDGYKLLFVNKHDLAKIYITPDGMTINGKYYKSVPTSTGTLVLLLNYFSNKGNK